MKYATIVGLLAGFLLTACVTTGAGSADSSGHDSAKLENLLVRQTNRGVELIVDTSAFFEIGKYELKAASSDALDRVATIVRERSKKDILIEGHTDSTGGAQSNQRLTEQRAEAVKRALTKRGVASNRMKTAGLGMSSPIGDNATAEGRRRNRRIQIVLLGESTDDIGGENAVGYLEGAIARLKELGSAVADAFKK